MDLEEEGVLKKLVIRLERDLALVVRRLARYDKQFIDIRFATRTGHGLRYTKKAITLWAEQLDDLIVALEGMKEVEVERAVSA